MLPLHVRVGAVKSTLMFEMVATLLLLPARSETGPPLTDWLAPSPSVADPGQGPAKPEPPVSLQVNLMLGAPVLLLSQPLTAGEAGLMPAEIVGAVLSILILLAIALALLPARSVQLPKPIAQRLRCQG